MNTGYIIKKLRLIGEGVEPAELVFANGANIITGPSNTGKTFIFESINYMLGSSTPPKGIKEARPYSVIYLELSTKENQNFTLKSDLKGGDLHLFEGEIDELTFDQKFRLLARKHNPSSEDTISAFLLSLNNSYPKKIRTNAKGKTRQISYRDIVRFLMINEVRIITRDSLIESHFTKSTEEKNTIKYIISGLDDSDVIASLSKTAVTNKKGRLDLLKELIIEVSYDIHRMKEEMENETLENLIERLGDLKNQYSLLNEQYIKFTSERQEIQKGFENTTRRKKVIEELYQRLNILRNHYNNDIIRLKSTIEATVLLQEGNEESSSICPLCKSKMPHECNQKDLNNIIISCNAEIEKIGGLLQELSETEKVIAEELEDLNKLLVDLKNQLDFISSELDNNLGVNLTDLLLRIEFLNEKKSSYLGINIKQNQLQKYIRQKEQIEEIISKSNKGNTFESLTTANMTLLSNQIESVLTGCNYPNLSAVSFSEDKTDFVISGEDRSLFGKGFRAIIYAAFIVAIQEILADRNYSIGVPVLDSPLVTYKKPNSDNEEIPIDLAMDFYRYIANNPNLEQIIIIENEEPPSDILDRINHIKFTQSNTVGRYGFIPI